jgi:D-alanyl-lipoteichoic acid acyltransferase DltB (MBOAT superfamily)
MLFAVQIYCDFAGYSTIAIGAAKVIGIDLMENFNAPYISTNVAEFWRKWHISLTSWFTDYLYIPLGGNRKGKLRKYINKIIVFLVSGLWHGASISFVIWGGLNGLYQIIGEVLMPVRNWIVTKLHLNRDSLGHKTVSAIVTFILVDFAWIFFRAGTTTKAFEIIDAMFTVRNPWILFDGALYKCGLDQRNFQIMLIGIFVLFAVDMCKTRHITIREVLIKQDFWCRLLIIDIAILVLLIFGIWGTSYDAASFIYFQF